MHARVAGQLRMERGDEDPALAREDRAAVVLGQHLDVVTGLLDPGRADEDAAQRLGVALQLEVGLEARDLAAVGVAPHDDVQQPEVLAVEHDHPGAGAEDGPLEPAQRLVDPVEAHQPRDRGRLAPRDHEPVETVELLGLAHLDHLRAERA